MLGGSVTTETPRGLWYEKKYRRYRVRLYRYGKAYLAGYFKTKGEAETALKALKKRLEDLRKPAKAKSKLNTGVLAI